MAAALVLSLALAIVVAPALATPLASDDSAPSPFEQTDALLEGDAQITNPGVAAELPHENLSREEAEELLEGVFVAQLENPAGIFDGDLSIDRFLSPNVAVVESEPVPGGGDDDEVTRPVLLDSTVPLRDESASGELALVDLGLEESEGHLRPVNPLAPVLIPREIGDGIALPDAGVAIEISGAPEDRAASVLDQSVAFVPNVAADTDLVIAPTPTGVETLTHLRSPDAPPVQTFDLQLPVGASLQPRDGGGAEVRSGLGEILVSISAPTAIDAAGSSIPVSMTVEGNSLTLVADPDEATQYPVLVDPLFQTYEWTKSTKPWESGICNSSFEFEGSSSCNNREEWGYEHVEKNWPLDIDLNNRAYGISGVPSEAVGLVIRTSSSLTTGDKGAMVYAVPRYYTDQVKPTSYISALTLSNLRWNAWSSSLSPYMAAGIWDTVNNGWISYYTHEGLTGHGLGDMNFPYAFSNPSNVNGKLARVMVHATETGPNQNTQLYVGTASVQLADGGVPTIGPTSGPTEWLDQTARPITFTASDTGLGAYSLTTTDQAAPTHSWKTAHGCLGVAGRPCPRQWKSSDTGSPAFKYEPSLMPQGVGYLKVVSEDPVGNKSEPAFVQVKVDHSAPNLAPSGSVTEQGVVGTKLPSYTLKYDASDGDEAAATAQAPFGSQGTAVGKFERPQGIAIRQSGNVLVTDRTNHSIVELDKAGTYIRQIGTPGAGNGQLNDPRGIALTSAGDIWVAEVGNKRLQKFNSSGQFVRTITYDPQPGKSKGFIEPWGVAVAPDQTLWVADQGAGKVFRFKEDGTYLGQVTGLPAGILLSGPTGITFDAFGNAWMADHGNHKVFEFNPEGKYLFHFGIEGTGNGQFKGPTGIAIAKSGHILVADADVSSRIQVFMPDGSYLRQFGTPGTSNAQLKEPRAIAVVAGNALVVADAGNHRVARWAHADQDPQSGVVKVEVKIDELTVKPPDTQICAKTCSLSGEWTLDADDYAVGQHKVEVIATDGVDLPTKESFTIETHGDRKDPTIALSGSMTEQATLGTTRPSYSLNANATDPGESSERQSGVKSVTIKVDGNEVKSTSPGCPAGSCSIATSWSLNSNSYSVGSHPVEVIAVDEAGRSAVKSLTINVARDTTAPTIAATNAFYNAPEGWVEQKSYLVNATGSDEGGYGITSIALRIDGQTVKSETQECPSGGCGIFLGLGLTLDMSAYEGGAHPAELRVTDGAGNVAAKKWTINVDPEGVITAQESDDTLEALDSTAESSIVVPTDEAISLEEREDGNNPALVEGEGALISKGVYNPSAIETDPEDGFRIVLPETIIEAEPVEAVPAATDTEVVEEAAGVSANVMPNVDLITRPTYNGLTTFANIRDVSGAESFAWEVSLEEGQSLVQIDPLDVEVQFADGKRAMLIAAERAHDAVGTNVPTSLSVSEGNVLTLTVDHRGANYVYPVIAGAGWEGGYTQNLIVGPKDEQEIKEEQERIAKEQQEALEREWDQEANGSEDLPPGTPSSNPMPPNDPMAPKYLRLTTSAPEMIDSQARKRRSKATPAWCANGGCSIWNAEAWTTFFWNGKKGTVGGFAWRGDTGMHCRTDGAWWVNTDITRLSWAGPNPAPYGYGQHLMFFCSFIISYISSIGEEETKYQMYANLYGSGYEGVHIREIESFILEG